MSGPEATHTETPFPATSRMVAVAIGTYCLATAVAALFYPHHFGLGDLDIKWLFQLIGGLPLFLGGLLLLLVGPVWLKRASALPLAWGLMVPLSGFVGAHAFAMTGRPHAMLEFGLPVLLLAVAAAWRWQAPPRPRAGRLAVLPAMGGLLVLCLLLSGLGRRPVAGMEVDLEAMSQLPAAATAPRSAGNHPDVLFISIDTLRADILSDETVRTPTLDALRARSRVAPYALAASPSTLPSHLSMMTGQSPLWHGAYTNLGFLRTGPPTLAEAFHEAGYRTAGAAANGLLTDSTGFGRGFESLINVASSAADSGSLKRLALSMRRMSWLSLLLGDRQVLGVASWLAERRLLLPPEWRNSETPSLAPKVEFVAASHFRQLTAAPQPFFYFLHFMAPHAPYDAIAPYRGALSDSLPIPEFLRGVPLGSNELTYLIGEALASGNPEAEAGLRLARARYGEELMMVDAALGRLLGQLEAAGRPTIILFTSDHGEHFGEHGKMRHGNTVYDAVLHVPFLLSGPGIEAGRFTEVPHQVDIPRTLLHAAGFPASDLGAGRDLLAEGVAPTEPYFAVHEDRLAVYAEGYKLILSWDADEGPDSPLQPLELYRDGQGEEENLLGEVELAPIQRQLEGLAATARDRSVRTVRRDFNDQDRAKLAELGYVFDESGKAIDD